jgi:hypothetical protein
MASPFTTTAQLAKLMSVSKSFLRELRESGEWRQGVHWIYLNPENPRSGIRYNTALCLNWLACRGIPGSHEQAIRAYLESLAPSITNV